MAQMTVAKDIEIARLIKNVKVKHVMLTQNVWELLNKDIKLMQLKNAFEAKKAKLQLLTEKWRV